MARRYAVGDRVDGLYDGNSDDVWYPGFITAVHGDGGAFDVLYDDGEAEHGVVPEYLRVHVLGTLCTGSRVYGRYAGGDEWYAGKIQEVQDDGTFTIEYDDGEVETSVPMEFIRETLIVAAEEDPADPAAEEEEAPPQLHEEADATEKARSTTPEENTTGEEAGQEEIQPVVEESVAIAESESTGGTAHEGARPLEEKAAPLEVSVLPRGVEAHTTSAPVEDEIPGNDVTQQAPKERRKSRTKSHSPEDEEPPIVANASAVPDANNGVVDEYANIVSTMERLEMSAGDATATKTLLSTLVKQMRAFPQATADLVHSRGGEALLMDILKQHQTHAVIQCYGFVLLRRLCFLCGKSTHYFVRNNIVNLVTIAMRKFPEDAILQASACGALAVFTRAHAGLAALLENRVSHLVLATIIFHKSYSVHTRQVHYYACEVLLELCELGDKTTIEALCGDGISGPGLSDLSPVSLLLFLLRQALSFEDKKACCAAGTLLMCLSSCHRHAAQMVLDLNGLSELSTVMAKYPMEPGIQKYAASASREIAMCSMDQSSPHRRVHHAANNLLGESNSMEDLHNQQLSQQRRTGGKPVGNSKSSSGKRKAPQSQRSGVSSMNGFPSPAHQQQVGAMAANARDALSFSKFTSPIGKAPHLPPNIRPFGDANGAPSPSAAAYHQQLQQQRNQSGSPLVILDSHGAMASDKKRFVKDERTNLLFETYGVDAKSAMNPSHSNDYHVRTHGIKRRQLKTHIISASAAGGASDGISWASPVKSVILHDAKPLSSRSDKATAKISVGETRKVRSSGGGLSGGLNADEEQQSPATLRRQQHQNGTNVGKKQESDVKTPRSASFQLKLEGGEAVTSSSGLASPIMLSPKTNRQGKNTSRSKATTKSNSSRPTARGKVTSRDSGVGSNASTESLNSYAAQLFKDEIEASAKAIGDASGAGEAAQERERLSFAEKLHKMIDKAKSSLAHTSTVSLTSEAQSSPVKTKKRPEPAQPAVIKKKQPPSVSTTTSRVAPASLKPSVATGDTASLLSQPDATPVKKPTAAAPKPAPVKKPTIAPPSTHTISSKPIAAPRNKANGSTAARAVPAVTSTPMKTTAGPGTASKPATKPASTAKPMASVSASKASQVVAATAATVAVLSVAESAITTTNNAETATPEDALACQPLEQIKEQPSAVIEAAPVEFSATSEVQADSAPVEASEPILAAAPAETVDTVEAFVEPVSVDPPKQADEGITTEQPSASSTEVPTSETRTAEAVAEEAAGVASSAADDLYADEYNDFDDLDNGPQTLDDDGVDVGADTDRRGSFEALMNLTAQVAEFSVATDTAVAAEIPLSESAEAPSTLMEETINSQLVDEPAPTLIGSGDVAVEGESTPPSLERDEPTHDTVDTPEGALDEDESKQTSDSVVEDETASTPANANDLREEENAVSGSEVQVGDGTESIGAHDGVVLPVDESADNTAAEQPKPHKQDAGGEEEDPSVSQLVEAPFEMDEQAQRPQFSAQGDRPESRQTDVSYADEDFDDAALGVDGDATVEEVEAGIAVDPPTTASFAVAELTVESEHDELVAHGNTDAKSVAPQPTEPEEVTAESSGNERALDAHAESSNDNEDEYGDTDFAGDESVPTEEGQAEVQDGSVKECIGVTNDSAFDNEAVEMSTDISAPEIDVDTTQVTTSEQTTAVIDLVKAEELQLLPGEPNVEMGDVASGVSSSDPPNKTLGSLTVESTGDSETAPAEEHHATTELLDGETAASLGGSSQSDSSRIMSSEFVDERTVTPDFYEDSEFDRDAAGAAIDEADAPKDNSEPQVAMIDDQQPEDTADFESEADSQQGTRPAPEEPEVPTVSRQATPDAYADESLFEEESTPSAIGQVDELASPQANEEITVCADPVFEGSVTHSGASELLGSESARDGREGIYELNNESTSAVKEDTERAIEQDVDPTPAHVATHDPTSPHSQGGEEGGHASDHDYAQSHSPTESIEKEETSTSVEPADTCATGECEVHEEQVATELQSGSKAGVLPVDDANSSDTGSLLDRHQESPEVLAADERGTDLNAEQVKEIVSPAIESRPNTAAAYDDDEFDDGETPRAEQEPSVDIMVNESISDTTEPSVSEPERIDDTQHETTEPASTPDEVSAIHDDAMRPATADAYGDDAEFEDEAPSEASRSPLDGILDFVTADVATDAEVSADAQGDQEDRLDVEAPIESSPDNDDELLMKDVNDLLSTPIDIVAPTEPESSFVDGLGNEEADPSTVPPDEVLAFPTDSLFGAAQKEESTPRKPQETIPSNEDDSLEENVGDKAVSSETIGTPEATENDAVDEANTLSLSDVDDREVVAGAEVKDTDMEDTIENAEDSPAVELVDTEYHTPGEVETTGDVQDDPANLSVQDSVSFELVSKADSQETLTHEEPPDTLEPVPPADEHPTVEESSESSLLDGTNDTVISNDDLPREDKPDMPEETTPQTELEPSSTTTNESESEVIGVPAGETVEESKLAQEPGEISEEPVENYGSGETMTSGVDEVKPEPETPIVKTARSDLGEGYGDDEFGDTDAEASTLAGPSDKPEESEAPSRDSPLLTEERVSSPSIDFSEPTDDAQINPEEVESQSVDHAMTSLGVAENQTSNSDNHHTEDKSADQTLEPAAVHVPDLSVDEESLPERPNADVDEDRDAEEESEDPIHEAVAHEDSPNSADSAEKATLGTSAPDDAHAEEKEPDSGSSQRTEVDITSSDILSEPRQEETPDIVYQASSTPEAEPLQLTHEAIDSDTSAVEPSPGAINEHHDEDTPVDTSAGKQEAVGKLPATEDESGDDSAELKTRNSGELVFEQLVASAIETEPIETDGYAEGNEQPEERELGTAIADDSIISRTEEGPSDVSAEDPAPTDSTAPIPDEMPTPAGVSEPENSVVVADGSVEVETSVVNDVDSTPPETVLVVSDDVEISPIDDVQPEQAPEASTPIADHVSEPLDSITVSEEPPPETEAEAPQDTIVQADSIEEALKIDPVANDNSDVPQEYAFEEDTQPSKEDAVEAVRAETEPTSMSVPAVTGDDEPLYKDDDNEFEEESPRAALPPQSVVPVPAVPTAVEAESVPSPSTEDAEYDDFEADETSTPRPAVPAVAAKLAKQPTKDEIDDETEYADDNDAYNDFEDDETPPAKTPPAPAASAAARADDIEDAYDMEETFDDEDTATPSRTAPAAAATEPSPADDGDYEAEYDDFED